MTQAAMRDRDRTPRPPRAWRGDRRDTNPGHGGPGTHRRGPWRPPPRDREGPVALYGWHTVKAALENPDRRFRRVLATENALHRLTEDAVALPIEPQLVRPDAIAMLV